MSATNSPVPAKPRPPARPQASGGAQASGGLSIDPVRVFLTYWPIFAAAAVVSLIIGVGLYVVLGRTSPKFTSVAVFQARPVATATTDVGGTIGAAGAKELEIFMLTQVQIIESDQILRSAIDTNEVRNDSQWIKQYQDGTGGYNIDEALKDLRDMVDARVLDETAIIQLRVTASSPDDARVIGTAIQERYRRDNQDESSRDFTSALRDVDAQILDLDAALKSTEQAIAARTRTDNVDTLTTQNSEAAAEIRQLQPALVDTRRSLADMRETLLQRERVLGGSDVVFNPDDKPIGFVYPEVTRSTAERSPIIAGLDQQVAQLEANIQSQSIRLGDGHPTIRNLRNQLRALQDQRTEELENAMANNFAAELEAIRNAIPRLERTERELSEDLAAAKNRQNDLSITLQEIGNLQADATRYREQLARLDTDKNSLDIMLRRAARVRVLSSSSRPDTRSFPQLVPVVGASVVLITGAVIALVLLKELREKRIRTPQDVAAIPRTRVLGILPDESMDPSRPAVIERACIDEPEGAFAEAVRQIRSAVIQRMDERGHKTLIVGCGMPGSGSTTVAINLASSVGATGRRVLVIDANLRKPHAHDIFDLSEGPGLSEVLRGESSLADAVHSGVHGVEGLDVLTAGTDRKRAYERFQSESMESLLETARAAYDVVILDVAPGVVSSDMNTLASYADASLLVVRAYAEKKGLVARLRNQLAGSNAEFMGVIVNAVRPAAGGYLKRNFEASVSYQQPKRVKNTAPAGPKKKLRGGDPKDGTPALNAADGGSGTAPDGTDHKDTD